MAFSDTELTIRTPDGGRITRRLGDQLREQWAERLTVVVPGSPSDDAAGILEANAEHLGVDVDLATGQIGMEGEAL